MIKGFEESMNPFDEGVADGKLYCVTTGKAASIDVTTDLLAVTEIGMEWKDDFVHECIKNPKRFEQPIKRKKVRNFAQDATKMKVQLKDLKVKEVRCTRALFGRLLYLAASQDMDLNKVLAYPLTAVPLSLAHIDGSMNQTMKSALMKKLEVDVEPE